MLVHKMRSTKERESSMVTNTLSLSKQKMGIAICSGGETEKADLDKESGENAQELTLKHSVENVF